MGQIKKLYQSGGNVETTASTESNAVYPVTASSAVYHQSSWGTGGSGQTVGNILTALDQGFQYMGVAGVSTVPVTATHKIFYLASEAGTYSSFGGISVSGLTVLKNSGSGWSKEELNITGGGGGTPVATGGYIGTTSVRSSSGAQNLTGISNLYIESGGKIYFGGTGDVYIEYDSNGFHFSKSVYSEEQVAAGGAGSGSGGGGGGTSYSAGAGIDITSGTISVTKASASALGGIKVGSGLSIDSNGVLSATGGGSGSAVSWGTYNSTAHTVVLTVNGTSYTLCENGYSAGGGVSSESDPVFTASAAYGISASDITSWNNKSNFSGSYNDLTNKPTSLKNPSALTFGSKTYDGSSPVSLTASDLGALTSHQSISTLTMAAGSFTAGTWTPTGSGKTFNIPTSLDHISDGSSRKLSDYVTLATDQNNISGEKTFTTKPVHITSSLDVSTYIDIGNARLEYDDDSNALRITKKTGTSNTIGLYADGFVSAGGTAASASRNIVFTDGDQTIADNKTFTGTTTLGQTAIGLIAINGSGATPAINNTVDRIYIQRTGQTGISMCATAGQVVIGALNTTETTKLHVGGNASFAGIVDTGYSGGHVVSIQDIVSRIVALETR